MREPRCEVFGKRIKNLALELEERTSDRTRRCRCFSPRHKTCDLGLNGEYQQKTIRRFA